MLRINQLVKRLDKIEKIEILRFLFSDKNVMKDFMIRINYMDSGYFIFNRLNRNLIRLIKI